MRVAHFNVTRETGGAERVIFDLAKFTDPGRVELSLWGSPEFLNASPEEAAGLRQVRMDFAGKIDVAAVARMAVKLRREKIDLVHAHQFRNGFYAGLAGQLAGGVPVIYTQHGREAWRGNFTLDRASTGLFGQIVAVSDAVKKFLVTQKRIPEKKITVIKNGIDTGLYRNRDGSGIRSELEAGADVFLAGVVGRLHEGKGHLLLLEAMEEVLEEAPNVRLVFIGEGGHRDAIEKKISELELEDRVTLLGFRGDVPEILAALDLLVLPSDFEGLPLTVLEAGASGTPVVATDVDGTSEVVEDGKSGWLVPPGDAEALARAIADAASSPVKRKEFALRLRGIVTQGHDMARVAEQYMELYSRITG